jgi:hypothetical protein
LKLFFERALELYAFITKNPSRALSAHFSGRKTGKNFLQIASLVAVMILGISPYGFPARTKISGASLPSGVNVIPTFQSLGLYWSPSGRSSSVIASVKFRKAGTSTWRKGLDLWFDTRNSEYRGSIVQLASGTTYDIQLILGTKSPVSFQATTWSDNYLIGETVYLPAGTSNTELTITKSGVPNGYVLYTALPGSTSTIDMQNKGNNCINISGSYVIVRGVALKGCKKNGIVINPKTHDIVIENNDISGWGELNTSSSYPGVGVDMQAGVYCYQSSAADADRTNRIIIQRNKIHDPRYTSNSWDESSTSATHPHGPQGITIYKCGGNHVIRYNEIYGSDAHSYNDGMGGGANFSAEGFPRADSDIYGNYIDHCKDNPIEAEGGNRNVRIWGNYMDASYTMIALVTTNIGPLYIWRNIANISHKVDGLNSDSDPRGSMFKVGSSDTTYPDLGKTYVFHNTMLQPKVSGETYPLGLAYGVNDNGRPLNIFQTRNNIFQIYKSSSYSIYNGSLKTSNSFDYDLYNGSMRATSGQETHGIKGLPKYSATNGPGQFALDPSSPGYDAGTLISNFNDVYTGSKPDVGAFEAGSPAMKFGVNAVWPPQ